MKDRDLWITVSLLFGFMICSLPEAGKGLCFGGTFAPDGTRPTIDPNTNEVTSVTFRRPITVDVPRGSDQGVVVFGDTLYEPNDPMKPGQWGTLSARGPEIPSRPFPVPRKVAFGLQAIVDRPFPPDVQACADRHGNVKWKVGR